MGSSFSPCINFLKVVTKIHNRKKSMEVRLLLLFYGLRGIDPPTVGEHQARSGLVLDHRSSFPPDQEEEGAPAKSQTACPTSTVLYVSTRSYVLTFPRPAQTAPPSGDSLFKHRSQSDILHPHPEAFEPAFTTAGFARLREA